MMMVDDGGGRGVKNGRKSDDVINGRPHISQQKILSFFKQVKMMLEIRLYTYMLPDF